MTSKKSLVLLRERTVLLTQGFRYDLPVLSNSKGKLGALITIFNDYPFCKKKPIKHLGALWQVEWFKYISFSQCTQLQETWGMFSSICCLHLSQQTVTFTHVELHRSSKFSFICGDSLTCHSYYKIAIYASSLLCQSR